MPILGDLSAALQGATAWTFVAATLVVAGGSRTVSDSGAVSVAPVSVPCRARVNLYRRRDEGGGAYTVTEVIILAGTLSGEPVEGNSITLEGKTYKLGAVLRDGIRSHWKCEVVDG